MLIGGSSVSEAAEGRRREIGGQDVPSAVDGGGSQHARWTDGTGWSL